MTEFTKLVKNLISLGQNVKFTQENFDYNNIYREKLEYHIFDKPNFEKTNEDSEMFDSNIISTDICSTARYSTTKYSTANLTRHGYYFDSNIFDHTQHILEKVTI